MTRPPGKGAARGTRLSGRGLTTRVKSAKGRKASSTRWLRRQLNDPYVAEARKQGLRSRSAFKLMELDDRFRFLKPGLRVIDLGAAPGGWSQVAARRVKSEENDKSRVIALDMAPMDPLPGVSVLHGDFMDDDGLALLTEALDGIADVVLSDMAAGATGHSATDHLRIMALCEAALDFAARVLAPGGVFVAKVLQGGTEHELLARMKRMFKTVRHAKPPASRADSAETYVVAIGFRGPD